MKLKKLTIDNIASIEHAVIDFDAAPLADEHLFLISGETGSGKERGKPQDQRREAAAAPRGRQCRC